MQIYAFCGIIKDVFKFTLLAPCTVSKLNVHFTT